MFEIQGNYATAKVFATTVDESAIEQIALHLTYRSMSDIIQLGQRGIYIWN